MSGFYGDLDQDQEAVLAEMHKIVKGDDHTLLRFLRARQFNLNAATELYRNYLVYRETSGIERILNAKLPKVDLYNKFISHSFHGFDKQGRPIYIEKTGVTDYPAVYEYLNDEELMQHHYYAMEYQVARCEESTKKLGKVVDSFCSIIDLKGLNMSHRAGVRLIRLWAAHDQAYYPERLGRLYIVNAPWVFPFFWKICSAFMDVNTIAKVHVLGKNYKKELLKYIDADQLPEEYGGTCHCNGPKQKCVPVADISSLKGNKALSQLAGDDVVTQTVGRRDKEVVELSCDSRGAVFDWAFTLSAKDIKFSIEVLPSTEDDDEDEKMPQLRKHHHRALKEPKVLLDGLRLARHEGSYTCKGAARMRFTFDNTYSRFTSKVVQHRITATPIEISQQGLTLHEDQKSDDSVSELVSESCAMITLAAVPADDSE